MSPASSCFSFETSFTTSPASTVELLHLGSWRVEDTTYLGRLFILSASSPLRDAHRGEPLIAPPAQQQDLGATRHHPASSSPAGQACHNLRPTFGAARYHLHRSLRPDQLHQSWDATDCGEGRVKPVEDNLMQLGHRPYLAVLAASFCLGKEVICLRAAQCFIEL
jgi:hypothetical protein